MTWKDIIKAPPFDAQERSNTYQSNHYDALIEKLEMYLDAQLDREIANKPFQSTFTLPMAHNKHQELVRLAGGSERLKPIIQSLYNFKSIEFKEGAVPGHTEGKMAYWIEK